ncbi:hypothetical protein SDC9_156140 [bioreactor metagenome]|uniref:Uncharacterized protein n=1 Tax=bioreactor metagenome TaxID=1076179 RepID=A0A645F8C6_9ZZZZ
MKSANAVDQGPKREERRINKGEIIENEQYLEESALGFISDCADPVLRRVRQKQRK